MNDSLGPSKLLEGDERFSVRSVIISSSSHTGVPTSDQEPLESSGYPAAAGSGYPAAAGSSRAVLPSM
eukprot:2836389-Pyramimonas_sp.AAC.1